MRLLADTASGTAYLEIFQENVVHIVVLQAAMRWNKRGRRTLVDSKVLTNWTYCPSDPKAIPFPPRQVMSLATMFVEFYDVSVSHRIQ